MTAPPEPVEAYAAAQVDADYVIHHAGACLGEPIEVVREGVRSIRVRGLVSTAERKAELLNQLARSQSFSLLRIDLRTVTEAAIPPKPAGPVARRETYISVRELPIQKLLEQAFGSEAQVAQFTNEAEADADDVMAHAWALKRLARNYEKIAATLRPESRWLLEGMVRDHLEGLRSSYTQLRRRFEPVMQLMPGKEAVLAPDVTASVTWYASLEAVFAKAQEIDRLVQFLVAGAGLEDHSGDVAVAEFRTELLRLGGTLQRANAAMNLEFHSAGSAARLR